MPPFKNFYPDYQVSHENTVDLGTHQKYWIADEKNNAQGSIPQFSGMVSKG